MTDSRWLLEFAALAEKTDRFADKSDHAALLAAGLLGRYGFYEAIDYTPRGDGGEASESAARPGRG